MKKEKPQFSKLPILILVIGFIGILYLLSIKSYSKKPGTSIVPTITPLLFQQQEIKKEISYVLPTGWKEIPSKTDNSIILLTSDYVDNGGFGKDKGIKVTIVKAETKNPDKLLDEEINPPSGAYGTIDPSSIEEMEINGRRAVKSLAVQEGTSLRYLIKGKKSVWWISFHYNDEVRDFLPNHNAVEKFIYSLEFKD